MTNHMARHQEHQSGWCGSLSDVCRSFNHTQDPQTLKHFFKYTNGRLHYLLLRLWTWISLFTETILFIFLHFKVQSKGCLEKFKTSAMQSDLNISKSSKLLHSAMLNDTETAPAQPAVMISAH